MQEREITPLELLQTIGELYVQTRILREQIARISLEVEKERETNNNHKSEPHFSLTKQA